MSQHYSTSNNNRQILYGYDAPTGGYFLTEFYRNDEVDLEDSDVAFSIDGLTLSELKRFLEDFKIQFFQELLLNDYNNAGYPTPLQLSVGKMFGKNIPVMLKRVEKDIKENFKNE